MQYLSLLGLFIKISDRDISNRSEALKIMSYKILPVTFNVSIPAMLRSLGTEKDRRLVISSVSLLILILFYFFVVGSALQTKIYTFQYRVTYESIFGEHIIDLNIDTLILISTTIIWLYTTLETSFKKSSIAILFLASLVLMFLNQRTILIVEAVMTLPVVSSLIVVDRIRGKRILYQDIGLTLDYITVTAIVLACFGIASLVVLMLIGTPPVEIEKYPYAIFQQILSILTPAIMGALVFCIPVKVLFNQVINKMKTKWRIQPIMIVPRKLPIKRMAIYLCLCLVLAVGVTLMVHFLVANPNSQRFGVDSPMYVKKLMMMKNQTADPIHLAFRDSGDRPLTLLILFLITETTRVNQLQVVEFSPLVLSPLLVIITFLLTRQMTENDSIAMLSSFLSAISFQTVIGIYSGFYANWIALILGYLAFVILIRCLKHLTVFYMVVLGLLLTGVLLAHVYTWTIIISVAFIFLIVLQILNYFPRKHILVLYLILSTSIAVDILKSSLTGSSTGLESDVSVGFSHGLGIPQFGDRLTTLADTIQTYYGGAYANIAILSLVGYWLVRCQPKEIANIFVLIFLSTGLIPLFIGDWILQSRVLYDIPFQIPAAISLYSIWKGNHKMIFLGILLIAVYLSFHVLANLGYVPASQLIH